MGGVDVCANHFYDNSQTLLALLQLMLPLSKFQPLLDDTPEWAHSQILDGKPDDKTVSILPTKLSSIKGPFAISRRGK